MGAGYDISEALKTVGIFVFVVGGTVLFGLGVGLGYWLGN